MQYNAKNSIYVNFRINESFLNEELYNKKIGAKNELIHKEFKK